MKPRIWYHATCKDLGSYVVLEPHIPYVYREPDIPRICVAPNVRCCLAAVPCLDEHMHVYVTTEPIMAYMPHDVVDSRRTHERWLLKPTMFIRLRTVYMPHGRGNHKSSTWQVDFKREYRP